jgi:hypothetical protein
MSQKKITEMKVLNIAQPFAHYVIHNGKNVENRTKDSKFRGTIAIYASKSVKDRRFEGAEKFKVSESDCAFGCIIGFVDIVDSIGPEDVTKKTEEWFSGPFGYVLENVIVLKKPISVSPPQGAVIWWTVGGSDLQKCLEQIAPEEFRKMNPVPCEPKTENTKKRVRSPKKVDSYDEASAPLLEVTPQLALVIGQKTGKAHQIVEGFWTYIRKNDLQDQKNKSIVHCDKKLKSIFGKDKVYQSEVLDLLSMHCKDAA